MKKRNKIRIFSFAAVALLILGGYLVQAQILLTQSKTELEYTYRRALNDLTDYVSDMEHTLRKSAYASTPTLRGDISAQLVEQSGGAKASMAILPFSNEKSERISRFVSQIGDYAMFLSRKTLQGQKIEAGDIENLENMEKYTVKLYEALYEVQAHLSVSKAEIGKTRELLNNVDEINNLPSFDDSLDEIAKEFSEFPSLLYDGPFSDHIMQQESLYLGDKPETNKEKAAKKAAEFLECDVSELTESGTHESTLAAYVFTKDNSRVNVTKRGCEISYFKKTDPIENNNLSYEQALEKASGFLRENGIDSFKESYFVLNDNMCTINFSYLIKKEGQQKNDVICYPDLIKVVIELDEGGMVEYDATGYLMNHHERDVGEEKLSLEEAKKSVSSALEIKGHEMAVIPTPGLDEVYCYEFTCKDKKGTDILLYVNAETGMEEQLYILTHSDNGILAN